MRSRSRKFSARRDVSSDHSNHPDILNETLPQQGELRRAGEGHSPRVFLSSVRPLSPYPSFSAEPTTGTRYSDPLREGEYATLRNSPLRRNTVSVGSSHRSGASLAPSSLRYLGLTPAANVTPVTLLGNAAATKSQRSFAPQAAPKAQPRFRLKSLGSRERATEARLPSVHPLLRQALLLTAAAEVEDRLATQQEETDEFDDIVALFSVAKEVEAVRVAAFEMFDLEVSARRTLHAQQKRERRILRYWYLESHNNAALSQEVRALQLEKGRMPSKQTGSLLRSRSASVQLSSYDLFDTNLRHFSPSQAQAGAPSSHAEGLVRVDAVSSPKRQLSYPISSTPNVTSTLCRNEIDSSASVPSTSYTYSYSTGSSPSRMRKSTSQSTESVNLSREQLSPSVACDAPGAESALDDRIAKQQLLLASGESRRSSRGPSLFPKRLPPQPPFA